MVKKNGATGESGSNTNSIDKRSVVLQPNSAARLLYENGVNVFPLIPHTKRPAIREKLQRTKETENEEVEPRLMERIIWRKFKAPPPLYRKKAGKNLTKLCPLHFYHKIAEKRGTKLDESRTTGLYVPFDFGNPMRKMCMSLLLILGRIHVRNLKAYMLSASNLACSIFLRRRWAR